MLVSAGAGKRSLVQDWLSLVQNWWLLVSAGAGKWMLVSAGAGRWSLVQEGGRWWRTGSCWCRTGSCFCREVSAGAGVVVAGAELVAAGAGRWPPVQESLLPLQWSGLWWKKVTAGAVSKSIRLSELALKRAVRLRGWLLCLMYCAVSGGVWKDFLSSPEKGF